MAESASVGKSVNRIDGAERVTGTARFCADIRLAGMLEGALLYSPYAHAKIKSIDTAAAEALPGVWAVATGGDRPCRYGSSVKDRPVMALDKVRFTGEVVAAVAAETEELALEACRLIRVEYEPLPPMLDPIASMRDRVRPYTGNICCTRILRAMTSVPPCQSRGVTFAATISCVKVI